MKRILLIGNPNVGKSVFFTELTGIHAMSSNYAGTTVDYMEGHFAVGGAEYTLIDVPGTYSLEATSEAEAVAAKFLNAGAAAVICVLDASNLERNLCLALELRKFSIPTIYILNLTDVAERKGIIISAALLAKELDAPVVSTVAVKKQGMDEVLTKLNEILHAPKDGCGKCANCANCSYGGNENCDIYARAKEINNRVSKKTGANPGFLEKLGDCMMKPFPGIFIALFVVIFSIAVVVFFGELMREGVLMPIVENFIVPFFRLIFTAALPEGMFLNILIGEYGVFVISFEWILAAIFPYVLMFYIVFGFLEDTGFLPRISVLFDNIMRKLGLQGGSLIYMMMGFGCAVPAIIGTRAATSRKERIVVAAAVCFAIPCMSQTGALISLISLYSWWMFPAIILFAFILFVTVTLIAGKFIRGNVAPLLIEVPNLLLPNPKSYGRKIFTRMKHFLHEAEVPMLLAILLAAILAESGALNVIAVYAQPIVSNWLGLPEQAVIALILGIIRREMSVAPLLALELTHLQAFVGAAVSLMYLPCISVFAILTREFKLKIALAISFGTIASAILIGGVINQICK
ncbi:MAG: ferrous iron transporter B [Clostridiales bacterium]|jgi:ferrous iron transport protein B|nr:ferrous iron transporter B [Clostridiales bacterium]